MIRNEIMICNKLGLHARAAAKFVNLAGQFKSDITVARGQKQVNGKSIMGVMMLAAARGTTVEITASGCDETDAILRLQELITQRFGEAE